MRTQLTLAVSAIALTAASVAQAASTAHAVTDLNLRAAPAPNAEIVDPLYAEGEVVVGATLPEAVTPHPVPDSPFEYVALNTTTVVVDPESRTIAHVIR